MDLITIIFVAFGLSMDAFAVSMCFGTSVGEHKNKTALRAGAFFGIFQAVMPLIGWGAGYFMKEIIQDFDHWVAFGLLVVIGVHMLIEASKNVAFKKQYNTNSLWVMLTLAVATSIDALAVGLSFAFLQIPILLAVAIIGVITFIVSFIGVHFGKKFSRILGNKAEIAGGIVLIGIGIKILVEHLYF
jgi:manganese efflux pump family protein